MFKLCATKISDLNVDNYFSFSHPIRYFPSDISTALPTSFFGMLSLLDHHLGSAFFSEDLSDMHLGTFLICWSPHENSEMVIIVSEPMRKRVARNALSCIGMRKQQYIKVRDHSVYTDKQPSVARQHISRLFALVAGSVLTAPSLGLR